MLFKDISVPYNFSWKKGDKIVVLAMDSHANYILKCFVGGLKTQSGSLKYNGKIGYIKVQ